MNPDPDDTPGPPTAVPVPAPAPSPAGASAGRPPLRLFLAIWPNPAALQAMKAWQARWTWPERASIVPAPQLHLTLHFLGMVPAARLPEVESGLAVPCPRFEIEFGRAQRWPGGLALLAPRRIPPPLQELHDTLGESLRALGLPVEERRYKPHVTLARRADDAVPPAEEPDFRWPVGGYALVHSDRGYHTIRRYR